MDATTFNSPFSNFGRPHQTTMDITKQWAAAACLQTSMLGLATALQQDVDEDGNDELMKACKENQVEVVKQILANNPPTLRTNYQGDTALHIAAGNCNSAVVFMLCRQGGSLNARNANEETPLISALVSVSQIPENCALNAQNRALIHNTIAILIHFGAIVDVIDVQGDTPLHWACRAPGAFGVLAADILLKAGASVCLSNEDGETPFDLAATFGNKELCAMLRNAGATPTAVFGGCGSDDMINENCRDTCSRITPSYSKQCFSVVDSEDHGAAELQSTTQVGWTKITNSDLGKCY